MQYQDNLVNTEDLKTALNQTLIDGILQLDFKDMQPWRELYRTLSAQYNIMDIEE